MKSIIKITIVTAILMSYKAYSQGFVDLDFENPIPPLTPVFNQVSASDAIPGWTAYLSGTPQSVIFYDNVSAGGAAVSLEDVNAVSPYAAIQGNYSVLLEGESGIFGSNPTTASIGQTGTIPITAQSITFYLGAPYGNFQISFNGQNLAFGAIGSGPNYITYAADISAFAGQTGQLLFTATLQSGALLDNIQFSNSPVPEPNELALGALGALLLGLRRWRNSSK